ncbi:amino acid adenylation domain-containing protein [Micromonospora tulbaghiae]|uniref:non-ribosomal peptide synthetase n=1 Tax=Micromonospora tulbaghiae TaxID=479978 RepID=UPI0033DF4EA3
MSDLMKRLARLPADRRAELLALLRDDEPDTAAGPTPRQRGDSSPLSYAQETLWFLDRLAPGQPTYNVPVCFRLRGRLDADALRTGLATVVARHESLRARMADGDDGPVQVVAAEVPVELPVQDVTGGAEAAVEAARALAREAFDLGRAPLWRARLIRVADDDHLFVFVVHHVVFDGWSLGVFVRELGECYRAAVDGDRADLEAVPLQYADYALWQREWLREENLERLTGFWRERLDGAPVLEFPTDRPRPAEATYRGTFIRRFLPVGGPGAVQQLARSLGTTPYSVYVAAFFALLHRYTGQDDLVIGSPTANRQHSEVEAVVGFFVNMLVLRADVAGDPTFRELAGRVTPTVQEAFAHGELPFEKLVEAVRPDRDPSRSPIFQIAFTFQNAEGEVTLPGLETERVLLSPGTSRFDMSWNLFERDGGLDLNVEFNTDLFDPESIEQVMAHYGRLLSAVVTDPDRKVTEIPLLDERERERLLHEFDGPRRERPDTTVVELFARQVAERPDAVAVVVGDTELSYAELDRRAEEIAGRLRAAGAAPNTLVGICLPRGADLVATVLAVLRCGAGYVPLDPGHPAARIAAILTDSEAVAVVSTTGAGGALPADGPAVVHLDRPAGDDRAEVAAVAPAPHDLAYALYTSGSTGTPKGVLIEHRAVTNFIASVQELFDLTPQDRVLGFAAVTFDVSVFEMFAALLTGARLYVVPDEDRLEIDRLQALLERAEITVIDLPPSLMALLEPERLPKLRIAFVGGEAFPGELVNRWNQGRRFFNGYGPTECTVTMVVQECAGTWDTSPPIGLPMANHVAHVLDPHGEPVPVGVPGELVIGGLGLARGYLNRPELSAEKFLDDPFGTAPGGRLYRTGDLVRRQHDGALVFCGRIDQQVKIRGLRIELGEIEAVLSQVPGVRQAVVQPWADDRGERHLVGYLTGEPPADERLRATLGEQLPPYMVPAYFVRIADIPLTTSGKVDRRALPAPETTQAATGEVRYADETEETLAREVVGPVLRLEQVGPEENFFTLGGHSLGAAQVVSRIRRQFGVEVGLTDFFRAPTVRGLAALVRTAQAGQLNDDDLLRMLESMSDEEAAAMLAAEQGQAS